MVAYYNEIDPHAAQWLRNLIAAGNIAPGDVDERSIEDVTRTDLLGYTQCHFFAGVGVWSLALRRAGYGDDRRVWTGSCPCQPFSAAGQGGGVADERHLWPALFHLIDICQPDVVLGEQVASLDGLSWLDTVQADLEGAGYAVGAVDTCAAGFGANHLRQRLYWGAAHPRNLGVSRPQQPLGLGASGQRWPYSEADLRAVTERPFAPGNRHPQPILRKDDDGYSESVGRLRAYGNALDAAQATAFVAAFMASVDTPQET